MRYQNGTLKSNLVLQRIDASDCKETKISRDTKYDDQSFALLSYLGAIGQTRLEYWYRLCDPYSIV